MNLQASPIGEIYQEGDLCVLFGNNQMGPIHYRNDLKELCGGDTEAVFVNQVHGDGIALVTQDYSKVEEADALITDITNRALSIKTADCLPIAISYKESQTHRIAMVHAGWRGVYNAICVKTLKQLGVKDKQAVRIWVGPHIQFRSFQIKEDVLELFIHKYKLNKLTHYYQDLNSKEHYFLNLSKVLEMQLIDWGIESKNIFISSTDTLQSSQFHSYRRDASNSGRNLSMICRLK